MERLLFNFRLSEGVAVESWCRDRGALGEELWADWQPELAAMQQEGILVRQDDRWHTTARGREVLDAILVRLMDDP